jgi:uncharacterized repeat protein (TIGR01451 family)
LNGLSRRVSALLAALVSAALGAVVVAWQADAAGPGGITLTGTVSTNAAGDVLDFAFTVGNAGGPALSDVTVDGIAFSGTGVQPEITCPQSWLPAGVTEICTAAYQLSSTDMSADTVSYTATVSGTASAGAAVTGPSAGAVYSVQHPTFIDSPDITNNDVGDVRKLPGGADVVAAYGNSWNPAMENSVNWAYATIASYQPVHYLISGDLTEGRWGEPGDASGLFGRQDDPVTRIKNMAAFYHGENVQRLKNAGLFDKLDAIPGDHDYGDNWWRVDDPTGYGKIKYDNFDIWRNSFYEHYNTKADGSPRFSNHPVGTQWDKTAYATMISPDMLLVSVDVFDRVANTDNVGNKVGVRVVRGQLAWFKNVLAQARAQGSPVKWIVVQGHVPAITPVRVYRSSGMHMAGPTTDFWQAMKQYKVNLYLAGEVHATTRRSLDGITQITTGAPLGYGTTTFVAVNEYSDHLGLVDWGWNVPENAPSDPYWDGACSVWAIEADKNACPPGRNSEVNRDYTGYQPTVEGTLAIKATNTADDGTGNLIEYVNPPAPTPVPQHAAISLGNIVSPTSVAAAGQQVTYSFRLNNTGNVALSNVTVNRTAFSGRGVPPAVTCPQDTLPVGVSQICTANYTVTADDVAAGTAVTDTATDSGVSPTGSTVSSNTKTSRLAMPSMPSMPAVSLSTAASPRSIATAGAKLTYTYTVKNTGNVALTAVRVRRPARTGTGTWSPISCPTTRLALGASAACTATYTSTQADVEAGTAITSTAVAGGTSPAGTTVSSTATTTRTTVTQRPALSLTEKANVASVRSAGQKITYRFAVTNNGNLKMNYLKVNDSFSGTGTRSTFHYPTRTLAPGATTTVTITYTVAKADITAGKPILSTSTVSGRRFPTTGKTTTSNKSRVSVAVR